MAYGGPLKQRDNFGRFQKQATINLTKRLQKKAEQIQVNVQEDIAAKLLEVYTNNVRLSYQKNTPRAVNSSTPTSYTHTDTFLENITTEIEKDKVKIVFKNPNAMYENGRTVTEVHEYLTEGTKGGGKHNGLYMFENEEGDMKVAYNYPTPKHDFEEHTIEQMKGFLETLNLNNYKK